jgi:hypothetical protein
MVFFLEITKIWQQVSRLMVRGFFSGDFLNPEADMYFPRDFWLFWICFIKLDQKTNKEKSPE